MRNLMVAKKTVAKKPVKKGVHKNSTSKKTVPMKSFHVYKNDVPFITFRITRQTVYWTVLLISIIVTQLWILRIQTDIATLTNTIISM